MGRVLIGLSLVAVVTAQDPSNGGFAALLANLQSHSTPSLQSQSSSSSSSRLQASPSQSFLTSVSTAGTSVGSLGSTLSNPDSSISLSPFQGDQTQLEDDGLPEDFFLLPSQPQLTTPIQSVSIDPPDPPSPLPDFITLPDPDLEGPSLSAILAAAEVSHSPQGDLFQDTSPTNPFRDTQQLDPAEQDKKGPDESSLENDLLNSILAAMVGESALEDSKERRVSESTSPTTRPFIQPQRFQPKRLPTNLEDPPPPLLSSSPGTIQTHLSKPPPLESARSSSAEENRLAELDQLISQMKELGFARQQSTSAPGGVDFSQATRQPDGRLCVIKEESVETLSKEPILECTHKNVEKCHYTYVTVFNPQQEEQCEENFEKSCQITFRPEATRETVRKCYRPQRKVCNGQGPQQCRTEYESSCTTRLVKEPVRLIPNFQVHRAEPWQVCGGHHL